MIFSTANVLSINKLMIWYSQMVWNKKQKML